MTRFQLDHFEQEMIEQQYSVQSYLNLEIFTEIFAILIDTHKNNDLFPLLHYIKLYIKEHEIDQSIFSQLKNGILTFCEFSKINYKTEIRDQISQIFYLICHKNPTTLESFIKIGGVLVLDELLSFTEKDWDQQKNILYVTIDNIEKVLQLLNDRPLKFSLNDYSIFYSHEGIMYRLSIVLKQLINDNSISEQEVQKNHYIDKICSILQLSTQLDFDVKFKSKKFVFNIVDIISISKNEHRSTLMNYILRLTSDITNLELFENISTIEKLVNLLEDKNIMNLVLKLISSFTIFSNKRVIMFVQVGIIPHLKSIITNDKNIAKLAHKILCDIIVFAGKEKKVRDCLWKNNVVDFLISILGRNDFLEETLNALNTWLSFDPQVENRLLLKKNVIQLCIISINSLNQSSLSSLIGILKTGKKLNHKLGKTLFIDIIINATSENPTSDFKYGQLMEILQLLFNCSYYPKKKQIYIFVKSIPNDINNRSKKISDFIEKSFESIDFIAKYVDYLKLSFEKIIQS